MLTHILEDGVRIEATLGVIVRPCLENITTTIETMKRKKMKIKKHYILYMHVYIHTHTHKYIYFGDGALAQPVEVLTAG